MCPNERVPAVCCSRPWPASAGCAALADQGYGGDEFSAWVAAQRKIGTLRLEVVPAS